MSEFSLHFPYALHLHQLQALALSIYHTKNIKRGLGECHTCSQNHCVVEHPHDGRTKGFAIFNSTHHQSIISKLNVFITTYLIMDSDFVQAVGSHSPSLFLL